MPTRRHAVVRRGRTVGWTLCCRLVAVVLLASSLTACGSRGGAGASASRSSTAAAQPAPESGRQWQRALAALGSPYVPSTPRLEPAAFTAWNDLLRRAWWGDLYHGRQRVEALVRPALDRLVQNEPWLAGWRDLVLAFDAPPAFEVTGPDTLVTRAPRAPEHWRVAVTFEIRQTFGTTVVGVPVATTLGGDLTLEASPIRITAPLHFDRSDPLRPRLRALAPPQIQLRLQARSSLPVAQQLLPALTAALDPVLRAALGALAARAPTLATAALPTGRPPHGLGGPGQPAISPPRPVREVARQISEEIAREHLPFGTIAEIWFDRPGYGNGVPVRYGVADSPMWTGYFLMAEAMRWELTGQPAALDAVRRATEGLADCLDVSTIDGRLSRCVVPDGPFISSIRNDIDFAWATLRGQRVGTLNNISRDQYLGALLGLSQVLLRAQPLRTRAAGLIERMVAYLELHDWVARRADNVTPARARYAFSPQQLWAAVIAGRLAAPQRFDAVAQRYDTLPSLLWLSTWISAEEPLVSYFKFNLGHAADLLCCTIETEPSRYRAVVQDLELLREATAHHLNAWFDAVYVQCVPAAAPGLAPRIRDELAAWTLRDRREQPVDLRNDPTIPTALYTPNGYAQSSTISATLPSGSPQPVRIARFPVPIEKRKFADFLWQRHPFSLTGRGDGKRQYPGVDLLLPYWVGRSYGLWR